VTAIEEIDRLTELFDREVRTPGYVQRIRSCKDCGSQVVGYVQRCIYCRMNHRRSA
jgi:hypothetical protein